MTWKIEEYTLTRPLDEKRLGKGSAPLTKLIFEEPDGVMLEEVEALGMAEGQSATIFQTLKLISIMSGEDYDRVRKMHRDDIAGAAEIAVPLLQGEEEGSGDKTSTPSGRASPTS